MDAHQALGLRLFEQAQLTLAQAAKLADLSVEGCIDLLGKSRIDAVNYPPSELEDELRTVL